MIFMLGRLEPSKQALLSVEHHAELCKQVEERWCSYRFQSTLHDLASAGFRVYYDGAIER